jgi:hypothetical protein
VSAPPGTDAASGLTGAPAGPDPARSPEGRVRAVEPSASYLLARLGIVESRVRALIAHRRRDDPGPEDPFRGLYLSDEQIDLVLASGPVSRVIEWDDGSELASLEKEADVAEGRGVEIRLRDLVRRAGLDELDVDLLLVALAPDLDVRFERLYGYLNDDVTRRRATVSLSLELAGTSPWSAAARARLSADAPLVTGGLVSIEELDRPYLSRSVRVPDRVAAHLLGDDQPDPAVADLLRTPPALLPSPLSTAIASVLGDGVALTYLRERAGTSAAALATSALAAAGWPAIVADLSHLAPSDDVALVAKLIRREALLKGAGVVAGPLDVLVERGASTIRALTSLAGPPGDRGPEGWRPGVPLVVYGRPGWEPSWGRHVPLVAEVQAETTGERLEHWETNLGDDAPTALERSDVTSQFLLSVEQVGRAVEAARLQAGLEGKDVNFDHLRAGARAQNGAGLERLARRIQPGVGWKDLVLAPGTADALRELAGRARRRDQVLDEWGMRPGGGRGRGITVLFAGDSGTGKTMSAEVVAGDLGLDLYTVNLATVVDKYVGETEKNLERIFTEADGVNAVLLFDEADALFGKRSEVRDANDRYANIEVAYLLQRMETFDGIAILATNLRANVDDAFARRLDMIVDFPTPDIELRKALWDRCLASGVPRGDDLDLDFCARSFELSGGNIRSVAITAAYLAADSGRPVAMLDLVKAIQQEYRKLGRLVVAGEFGSYYSAIST